ncbi:MAG: hypothetical protein K2P69_08970, partial [Eubacterium sp.]|nr:hypothetical protein [Eubacterium sp.]
MFPACYSHKFLPAPLCRTKFQQAHDTLVLNNDRLVVESPGRLPGLVRADNIRHTHFSRNPKIAEFLRVFNFVKEYGEGVDRMCLEMETKGLRGPEYHTNAFLLQTVVYNAACKKAQVVGAVACTDLRA